MSDTADPRSRSLSPGRLLRSAARTAASAVGQTWLPVNRLARSQYRALKVRHPQLAEGLRTALWPVLRLGNRYLLGISYIPMTAYYKPGQALHFQRPLPSGDFAPLVTVIVPNYNHAPYLRQRLDSVYAQTYPNVEVLLMDDCSSDDSRAILTEYRDRFPDRTRLLLNEVNSGGVFFQWEKGLREARGELVWIAESDDWCDPNFLETLVPFFKNPAVMLSYARTEFMSGDGSKPVWSMDHYLADVGGNRWHRPWIETAPDILRKAFGQKNIIPNVSSAVFRKVDRLDALGIDRWRGMKTCGDWMFYLNILRGGLLAYSPKARNYYRLHQTNTSVGSYSTDQYYREHEAVAKEAARLYGLDEERLQRQREDLIHHWKANRPEWDVAAFDACYDLRAIRAAAGARKPNVLVVGYGFCSGGGETFAIQVANQMKAEGHNVTFLDCGQEPEVPGIRALLDRDIPVVTALHALEAIVEAFEIDIIHSHHAWVDNSLLDLLPEGSRARHVLTLHGMYETIPEKDLDRIVPRMARRVSSFAYISDKNLGPFVSRVPGVRDRFQRIDNALAPVPFEARSRAEFGIPDDAFLLVTVSRAMPEKGWREAVAAVTRAREATGRDIHLMLVGDGVVHQALMSEGTPDFVHLAGFRPDTRAFYAMGDLGLLPSRFAGESFPLVLIECLQAGRPMLATALGEIPRMLDAGDGRLAGGTLPLVDGGLDVEGLAQLIGRFAAEPGAYAEALARVPEAAAKFDPRLMRAAYSEVYDMALRQRLAS
ncbi:hypothetical protein Rumeso_03661 [Rubellimicrobium mesophilum DSM 19309]|uniref:Glycosyltransferase n=1 Tax=Rubellimicrobium mesophilum DSM 19309 TaxID=442562 RepID=A0A017HKU9_9RHOB|nr:glycosyltransferase [Rubellimicrobium mesophilum]EYD74798.1 hypothetical protein Rumeso_03661 [Rubellimicrobium mesophilum DSM 19309]